MTKKTDGNIQINMDDPVDYLEFVKYLSEISPKHQEFAIKQHNQIRKFYMESLINRTKELHEKVKLLLQKIPIPTKEREAKIRELTLQGKSNEQIAEAVSYSVWQIKRDKNLLNISRKRHKK